MLEPRPLPFPMRMDLKASERSEPRLCPGSENHPQSMAAKTPA